MGYISIFTEEELAADKFAMGFGIRFRHNSHLPGNVTWDQFAFVRETLLQLEDLIPGMVVEQNHDLTDSLFYDLR